jgi:hypothetical protein
MSEHEVAPSTGPTSAPPQIPFDHPSTLRNLAMLQDQILFLQSEANRAKAQHDGELSQMKLQMKERDMLLEEVVARLKRSNREKHTLREKLDKMEAVYDSNVLLKGEKRRGAKRLAEKLRLRLRRQQRLQSLT